MKRNAGYFSVIKRRRSFICCCCLSELTQNKTVVQLTKRMASHCKMKRWLKGNLLLFMCLLAPIFFPFRYYIWSKCAQIFTSKLSTHTNTPEKKILRNLWPSYFLWNLLIRSVVCVTSEGDRLKEPSLNSSEKHMQSSKNKIWDKQNGTLLSEWRKKFNCSTKVSNNFDGHRHVTRNALVNGIDESAKNLQACSTIQRE